jgi:hypothetical protein
VNVLFEDPILRLVGERDLLVGVWFDAPALEHIGVLSRESHALHARFPRTAYANVIVRGVPKFTTEVRAAVEQLTRETDPWGRATAHVILLGGLAGSAVRAFLSTTMLVARSKTPTKVFGDTAAAAKWMSGQLAEGAERWTFAELHGLLERARA